MRSELGRLQHELQAQQETIKENEKKIKQNKTLPYLVSNIIEVLDINPEEEEQIEGTYLWYMHTDSRQSDRFICIGRVAPKNASFAILSFSGFQIWKWIPSIQIARCVL